MSDQTPRPPSPGFNSPPVASSASPVTIPAAELARFRALEAEYQEFQAKTLPELRTAHEAAMQAKEAERLQVLAERDGAVQILGSERQSWGDQQRALEARVNEATSAAAASRQRHLDHVKAVALADALAGCVWSGESPEVRAKVAARFRRDLEPSFEVIEENGQAIVKEKATGRPISEVIPAILAAPDSQIYFAPSSRGGSGTDGTGSIYGSQLRTGSAEWHAGQLRRGQAALRASTGIILE